MFGKRKQWSSKQINVAYEHMSPLQQQHFRDSKFTPEKTMNALGVELGRDRIPIVPEYETKSQWKKIKKCL